MNKLTSEQVKWVRYQMRIAATETRMMRVASAEGYYNQSNEFSIGLQTRLSVVQEAVRLFKGLPALKVCGYDADEQDMFEIERED